MTVVSVRDFHRFANQLWKDIAQLWRTLVHSRGSLRQIQFLPCYERSSQCLGEKVFVKGDAVAAKRTRNVIFDLEATATPKYWRFETIST